MSATDGSPGDGRFQLGGGVRTVSGLTLVSRVAGLARDLVTVRVFGDTAVGSAFAAAFAIPNMFRRLFGEGALSAAFLPEYARLDDESPDHAGAFASLTIALLSLVTGGITVFLIAALGIVLMLTPPDADRTLSLTLIMVMLPFMPLICVAAILGGMLQAHGRFGPWAAAPILLNACMIAASVPYFLVDGASARSWAYIIGVAAVVSGVLQVAWSALALRGRVRWTRAWSDARERTAAMLKRMVPVLIGLGTLQVNALIDTLIAMWPNWIGPTLPAWLGGAAYPLDTASNSVLFYAQRLYQFPLGVFGIAVATVVFPMLSRAAGDETFRATLRAGVRLSLFIALPAAAGLVLVRDDLVRTVFTGFGEGFSETGVTRASAVLLGYAVAIPCYSMNQLLTRAFYARGDTATPMRIAVSCVGLNLVLNVTLIWIFRPYGEAGLAWSTAISATVQMVWMFAAVRRKLPARPVLEDTDRRAIGRAAAGVVLMAVPVWLTLALWPARETWGTAASALAAACAIGATIYLGSAAGWRSSELRTLVGRRLTPGRRGKGKEGSS